MHFVLGLEACLTGTGTTQGYFPSGSLPYIIFMGLSIVPRDIKNFEQMSVLGGS